VTPAQRLVVALAAVHAARAVAIRELALDDLNLAGRRIRLGGRASGSGSSCTMCCASGCATGNKRAARRTSTSRVRDPSRSTARLRTPA
jgi:hypothetical protein